MKNQITVLLFFLAFLLCNSSYGQVMINEFSVSNLEGFVDNYGKYEDWVELYNIGSQDVDLGGYHLTDKASKPGKWEIPAGTIIPANGHLVFWCSGRDASFNGHYHTNFKLSQSSGKDRIILTDPSEAVLDEVELELTLVEHSRGRRIDGSSEWGVFTQPSLRSSNGNSSQYLYNGYTSNPTIVEEAGFYQDSIIVTIENSEPNSTLKYTTDGTNPNDNSETYEGPIKISKTTVVKAASISDDAKILQGKMDFKTFFINEDFTLAVFSVGADDVIELANGNGDLIPIGSLEYFNLEKKREATSFGSLNRHGQDSWVLPHRSIDWVSRDEMGYSKAVEAKLFSYSDRDEYQRFMFRNSGDDNYPARDDFSHEGSTHIRDEYVQTLAHEGGLKLDRRAVERVILFLNGEYWGVYGMRERPVDHDYTDYYYDQDKYNVQYITTWGNTEAQYGGQKAFNDWIRLRDFILDNDMSVEEHYKKVKDEYNVLSLIDYMTVNLNCVASDWLNYNTGFWRGLNPEGDHKKWGYILWDLDATFDYYINYSGVPNTNPDAVPCDIEDISDFMDNFFGEDSGGGGGGGGNPIDDPENCATILNGSSPYPPTDTVFQLTIAQDNYCCNTDWDNICQNTYNQIASQLSGGAAADCPTILNGSCPYPASDIFVQQIMEFSETCCEVSWNSQCQAFYDFISAGGGGNGTVPSLEGNVGKHEKIFLKLQEENPEFKQLYYSRQADLMNTVYTCENMMSTLDRMLAVIEPEMPRQIQRWGGSMNEWQQNVNKLKSFIMSRCELFDDGLVECFDLTGPFPLTIMTSPEGVGSIKLNTIELTSFPWTGDYFGGMDNKINANVEDDNFEFSHWESTSGHIILPDVFEDKATIQINDQDTLIAVYKLSTAVTDLNSSISLDIFPNPASNLINLRYSIDRQMEVNVSLVSMTGQTLGYISEASGNKGEGQHATTIDLDRFELPSGMYLVRLEAKDEVIYRKLSVIR